MPENKGSALLDAPVVKAPAKTGRRLTRQEQMEENRKDALAPGDVNVILARHSPRIFRSTTHQ